MCNKINPDPPFTLYTKDNSKWIVDPNVRVKTNNNKQTKQKEPVGENRSDIDLPRLNKLLSQHCAWSLVTTGPASPSPPSLTVYTFFF